jgi:hypothetical protein
MLHHLVNHSTYHRGQVTALLRQLGAGAVATDFLVFIDEQTRVAEVASSAGLRPRRSLFLGMLGRPCHVDRPDAGTRRKSGGFRDAGHVVEVHQGDFE